MTFYYLFKQLYAADTDAFGREVVQTLRTKWQAMIDWPPQTTWEFFGGGSKAHIYGMFPVYYPSSYVLGLRLDMPVRSKHLLIEPRLGVLTSAEGVVVTQHGRVPVAWEAEVGKLSFHVEIPAGVTAALHVPKSGSNTQLQLDGAPVNDGGPGRYFSVELRPGVHTGAMIYIRRISLQVAVGRGKSSPMECKLSVPVPPSTDSPETSVIARQCWPRDSSRNRR